MLWHELVLSHVSTVARVGRCSRVVLVFSQLKNGVYLIVDRLVFFVNSYDHSSLIIYFVAFSVVH